MVNFKPIRIYFFILSNKINYFHIKNMFDDNDDTPVTLTINKSYANRYETWREKEEKQKCRI